PYTTLFRSVHPQVVVAHKIADLDTHVRKLGQFPQGAGETFGHNGPVFEPKVEQVPHQENGMCIVLDGIQPGHEFFFPWQTVLSGGCPKVVIAGEIDCFAFWKGDVVHLSFKTSIASYSVDHIDHNNK